MAEARALEIQTLIKKRRIQKSRLTKHKNYVENPPAVKIRIEIDKRIANLVDIIKQYNVIFVDLSHVDLKSRRCTHERICRLRRR